MSRSGGWGPDAAGAGGATEAAEAGRAGRGAEAGTAGLAAEAGSVGGATLAAEAAEADGAGETGLGSPVGWAGTVVEVIVARTAALIKSREGYFIKARILLLVVVFDCSHPIREFLGSEPKFTEPTARPEGAVRCTAVKLVSDPNNS